MEQKIKEDEHKKKEEEAMKNKKLKLQPKLDLLHHQRDILVEKNQQLQQELNAMKIKHKSGLAIIDKLVASFQYFITETKAVDEEEARKLSTQLIKKESEKDTNS